MTFKFLLVMILIHLSLWIPERRIARSKSVFSLKWRNRIGILVACRSHPSLLLLKHPQALRENVLWAAPSRWEDVAFLVVVSPAWSWHQAAPIIGHSSLWSRKSVYSLSSCGSRHWPSTQAPTHQSKCWWVCLFCLPSSCRFFLFLCLGWSLAGSSRPLNAHRLPGRAGAGPAVALETGEGGFYVDWRGQAVSSCQPPWNSNKRWIRWPSALQENVLKCLLNKGGLICGILFKLVLFITSAVFFQITRWQMIKKTGHCDIWLERQSPVGPPFSWEFTGLSF